MSPPIAACVTCLALVTAAVPARTQEPASPQLPDGAAAPDAPPYAALVERIKGGDRTVDFTRLRMAYAETPAYDAMMMGAYQALWTPLAKGDFAQAIAVAEKVLERNFAEVNAHMVAALAYQQTGERAPADFHRFVASGLLRSIASSGDGRTPETAFVVIDVSEEFALIRSMNLTPKSSGTSGVGQGPHIDALFAVDPRTGAEQTIYFNVDRVFERGYKRPAQ